jgi:biopolymer transport protein ExbB
MSPLMLGAMTFAWAEAPAESSLDAAYRKEYAYLVAEKAELTARLAELESESASKLRTEDAALEALQTRLVAASRRADHAEDEFDQLEREASAAGDAESLLSSTLQQAGETLSLTAPAEASENVTAVFTAAAARLESVNALGWREGSFFLPTGEEATGRVFQFGQVGAWGLADAGSGSLAPAGEGRLQLRRDYGHETTAALAAETTPATIDLHLFEAERGAEEPEKAGGLGALLKEAGTMGQVLFGLGMISLALVLGRLGTLVFARRGGQALATAIVEDVRAGRLDRARATLARRAGPLARVLGAMIREADRPREELERVVDEAILRETPIIDRFASALVVITAGAPLLGLLGTVTGMIATFNVITEHGTGNPKLMSAGIAEALVCTAFGLSVAIPTLLAGNVLASIADGIKNTIERAALALLNALEELGRNGVEAPREVVND